MKASEACESFKSMNDQRSESLSTPFLNTETVSYGSGWSAQECGSGFFVCALGNIMAIVLSENICPFFFCTVEAAKSTQSGERAQGLYGDKRPKDETDLSGISWALGTQCMAAALSGLSPPLPPPSALGDAHKPKTHATNIHDFLQRLKTYIWPILPSACSHITRRNPRAHTH